ncbi:MAG TPA: YbaN family protein [Blastocatellia bacterium]|nr:YbaN family protein [Blastocatellia bacterium]
MLRVWKRGMYIAAGFICFGLGVAGALLPLLPATPFLLLSAFFFARSSERWHEWLVTHRTFGPYIAAFREKRGLTAAQKRRIALTLTLTLLLSFWLVPRWYARLLIGVIWFFWMIVLFRSRTATEAVVFEEAD